MCFSAKLKDKAWLWKYCYGLLNFNGLRTLYQKSMVNGIPQIAYPLRACQSCVVANNLVVYFHKVNLGERRHC